jgi:hypothetical protein
MNIQIIWMIVNFLAITSSFYYAITNNFQPATYYLVLALYALMKVDAA